MRCRADAKMASGGEALLLKHGASADARDAKGRTALDIAVERDEEAVAEVLRKHRPKQ